MPRRRRVALGACSGLLLAIAVAGPAGAADVVPSTWRAGVNLTDWSSGGYAHARDALVAARADGVTSVSLVPTLYVDNARDSSVAPDPDLTPTDDSLRAAAQDARSLGMTVTIKPHVDPVDGSYRGDLNPSDPAAWFDSYDHWLVHYALLAQQLGARQLVIGTELDSLVGDTAEFDRLIRDARGAFHGELTYAANWSAIDAVGFWSELDLIGVDAYVPLGDAGSTPAQLRAAWTPLLTQLTALNVQTGKPVTFTELGYQSRSDGLKTPFAATGPSDEGVQARGYAAAFAVWSGVPWFRGISWWDWPADPVASKPHDGEFSPRGKRAEGVLQRWTGGPGGALAPGDGAGGGVPAAVWLAGLLVAALILAGVVVQRGRRHAAAAPPPAGAASAASAVPAAPARRAVRIPAITRVIRIPDLALPAIRVAIVRVPHIRRLVTRQRADGGPARPLPGSPALVEGGADDIVDPVRMACLLATPAVEPLLIQARFTLDSHSVVLFLRDPNAAEVVHVAMAVGVPEDLVGRQLSIHDGLMGVVLQTGNPISVADRSQLPHAIEHPLIGDQVTAALSVPVRLGGRVIGALTVGRTDPFAPSERHLLAPIADGIAQLLPPWLLGASWPNAPELAVTPR